MRKVHNSLSIATLDTTVSLVQLSRLCAHQVSTVLEEMRSQLTAGPVEVFAYRNMTGDIDEGKE